MPGDVILDAGCGAGRNLHWFLNNGFNIFGIDEDDEAVNSLLLKYPGISKERIKVSKIENSGFAKNFFDHIICSAVLHFAESREHFDNLIAEIARVVKPGGTVFIRMTSDIGIEHKISSVGDGVYLIPDGSTRFLLTKMHVAGFMHRYGFTYLEPLKTVNVDDQRCMSTLMLQKQ